MDQEKTNSFRILMFPWLAHGHIFPYLELAKRITKIQENFHILLCTTAINFPSINTFLHTNSLTQSIQLLELHLEPNPLLPPHLHTTKNLPSNLNLTLLKAFQTAKSSFSDIISVQNPDLIIYDIFQPWAATIASSRRIPAVHFAAFGAATMAFVHYHYTEHKGIFPFLELDLKPHEKGSVDNLIEFLINNVFDGDKDSVFVNHKLSSEIVLLKTSKGLEGKYLDYFSSLSPKRNIAVGPLVTETDQKEDENSEIIQWLNKKRHHSTVYISFGSECFLSEEERGEIAKGLELCDQSINFVWVIRFPVLGDDHEKKKTVTTTIEESLPHGFLDRVKGRGMVVSGWAPQMSILRHPSIGAFASHCGWSSVMESVYFGVPVIGMPMKLNMFIDCKMVVDRGICVEVRRGENEVFKGEEMAKVMDEVVLGESGEEMRRQARDMRERVRVEEEEGVLKAAEKMWELCFKKKNKKW